MARGRGLPDLWRVLDRSVAIVIVLTNLAILVASISKKGGEWFSTLLAVALGCLPSFLIWRPKFVHALLFTVLTVVCCQGAYTLCDISSGPVTSILHPVHNSVWVLTVYGAFRTISLVPLRDQD